MKKKDEDLSELKKRMTQNENLVKEIIGKNVPGAEKGQVQLIKENYDLKGKVKILTSEVNKLDSLLKKSKKKKKEISTKKKYAQNPRTSFINSSQLEKSSIASYISGNKFQDQPVLSEIDEGAATEEDKEFLYDETVLSKIILSEEDLKQMTRLDLEKEIPNEIMSRNSITSDTEKMTPRDLKPNSYKKALTVVNFSNNKFKSKKSNKSLDFSTFLVNVTDNISFLQKLKFKLNEKEKFEIEAAIDHLTKFNLLIPNFSEILFRYKLIKTEFNKMKKCFKRTNSDLNQSRMKFTVLDKEHRNLREDLDNIVLEHEELKISYSNLMRDKDLVEKLYGKNSSDHLIRKIENLENKQKYLENKLRSSALDMEEAEKQAKEKKSEMHNIIVTFFKEDGQRFKNLQFE